MIGSISTCIPSTTFWKWSKSESSAVTTQQLVSVNLKTVPSPTMLPFSSQKGA